MEVEGLEGRTLMTYGGSPDLTFGINGYAQEDLLSRLPNYQIASTASALQADGKLVVVGSEGYGGFGQASGFTIGFSARRYDADGTPDPSFDATVLFGISSLRYSGVDDNGNTPAPGGYTGATGVAIQADGKILVVGDVSNVAKVIRLDALGKLDPTFGTGGIATLGTAGTGDALLDYASAVALLPGGRIAVAGAVTPTTGHDSPSVEVLTATGAVDTTFGEGGLAVVPTPVGAGAFAPITPVPPTGSPFLYTAAGPVTLAIQLDGKLIVAADAIPTGSGPASSTEIVATRISSTGAIDLSYGMAGQSTIAPRSLPPGFRAATATALAIQLDGKLVIGGAAIPSTPGPYAEMLAARLDSVGVIDPTFGVSGLSILPGVDPFDNIVGAIAIQPDGKIVLADRTVADFDRLTPAGLPDISFGNNGLALVYTNDDSTGINTIRAGTVGLAITAGGKSVVAENDAQGGRLRLLGRGAAGDFDGDGVSDPTIFLTATAQFIDHPSSGQRSSIIQFGEVGAGKSLPAPGAYAGSGHDEDAVYVPSMGAFAVKSLVTGLASLTPFGTPGVGKSLPAPGDYDGSGKTEYAVYLTTQGEFAYRPANGGPDVLIGFGTPGPGKSIPVPADYFGTGRTDLALYLPDLGAFAIRNPITNQDSIIPYGTPGPGKSIPVPGDYDGSGHVELAVYLPDLAALIYRPAGGGPDVVVPFGTAGRGMTLPAPGDYDGSGKTEVAAYIPSLSLFAYRPANGGTDVYVSFASAAQAIFGNATQAIPFVLASSTDTSTGDFGFSAHAASAEIPLTPDVLESLLGTSPGKTNRRA